MGGAGRDGSQPPARKEARAKPAQSARAKSARAKPAQSAQAKEQGRGRAVTPAAGDGSSDDDEDDEDVFARRTGKKRSAQKSKDTPAPKRANDGGGGGGGPAFVANPALRGQPAVNEYFSTHKAESTRPTEEVLNQFEHDELSEVGSQLRQWMACSRG